MLVLVFFVSRTVGGVVPPAHCQDHKFQLGILMDRRPGMHDACGSDLLAAVLTGRAPARPLARALS